MKCYCRSNLLVASVLNFERLVILRDSIGLPSEKLLSFEFATGFGFKFQASRYITGLNQTSEENVMVVELAQRFHIQFRASRYITGLNQTFEKKVIVV